MPDIYKAIKALTIERECVSRDCNRNCGSCDLAQDRDWLLSTYDDALELLKKQKPRVLILSEINKNYFVWYENNVHSRLLPALVVDCQSITRHKFIVEDVFFDVGTYMPEDVHYGKSWRCWNHKPTDEQRKAVKWE